jgi:hypothetical protein
MKEATLTIWKKKLQQIDWKLLLFLVLVLNVKLVVKILALLLLTIIERRSFSIKGFLRQPYLFFYFGMICTGVVNLLLQYSHINIPYLLVTAMGILFWVLSAMAAYHSFQLVQKGEPAKMHNALAVFFMLHIGIIFINFLLIIYDTGVVNPYTYKGLHQKYYISTGDFLRGITFDSPVTTAMIAAFGLVYFFYRRQFFFSILCMAGLLLIFSNLTNIFLLAVFAFIFLFRSDRVQKSMILVYISMLLIFITQISPQNNEHAVSFVYKLIGKAYYLPTTKPVTNDSLKKMPDSMLSYEQLRRKKGLLYIDSINGSMHPHQEGIVQTGTVPGPAKDTVAETTEKRFYEYRATEQVEEKENRFRSFLNEVYTVAQNDSLQRTYNWNEPGKWIAFKQLCDFYSKHPGKLFLGNGIGNFSSRVAFKATALNVAGGYPARFRYIHPDFQNAHLYTYLYYHAKWQMNHTAANIPDSVYHQLLGEYGVLGLGLFLGLYLVYFTRRKRYSSYGLPLLLLVLMAFLVEYWFEQLSIVVLFELLVFLDAKTLRGEEQKP